jgi:hypothetical protein
MNDITQSEKKLYIKNLQNETYNNKKVKKKVATMIYELAKL